jgi:integrase/recombinase XerD
MAKKPRAPRGCFWRGSCLWGRVKVRGRDIKWSLHTDNPAIARQRREEGKKRAVAIAYHGDAEHSFEDILQAWAKHIEAGAVGPKTATRYLCSLGRLGEWLEGRGLREIDGKLVAKIISERSASGVKNATVKRDLVALSSVMNFAIVNGWRDDNPVVWRMKLVKERRDPIVLPRQEDIALVGGPCPRHDAPLDPCGCRNWRARK